MDRNEILRELAMRELARRNYGDYLCYVNAPFWKRTRLSMFLAEKLQKFLETDTGNAYDILILETPPQHGKSMTVTEALPAWYLGRHPQGRVIEVSYNEDTGERFLRKNKEKVKRFGKVLFDVSIGKVDRADHFELESGGVMLSRGILSGITGNPADLLIIDDPIKSRQEADSETVRDRLWGEWLNSMKSRLSAGAKVILIMTPWHEDDMAARILAAEEHATLIRLPVEAGDHDPLGRQPGEPLCPEIGKGERWLRQFKQSYLSDARGGPRAWSSLYMCRPVAEGGNLVKRDWWRYYDPGEITRFATECISVDAAFKDADHNDYVSIQVWGKKGNDYYLRYLCNEHLDFAGTLRKIRLVRDYYPNARRVYIEDKANGTAIIQILRREMTGVISVEPLGGKVSRVNAVSPAIETGHVLLPKGAPWLEDFLRQWSEFPAGKHDDMVDAATQALSRMVCAWGGQDPGPEPDWERELYLGERADSPYM